MIVVSFCCNNPDNGMFDGTVASIEIHGTPGYDITLEPRTYPPPRFDWLDKPPKYGNNYVDSPTGEVVR